MMNVSDFKECLIEPVSVQEAEARQSAKSSSGFPFGLMQQEWVELIAQMEPGDELWSFSTLDSNKATVLADGYVIRRGDKLVNSIFTKTYF